MSRFDPTTIEDWTRSDQYHDSFLLKPDPDLDAINSDASARGVPDIQVSAAQGKFLHLLVKSLGSKKVLEVGTLAGYSTIWLAKALPADGQLITLEINDQHAKIATENIASAALSSKVQVVVGPAAGSLQAMTDDGTFDFAFIDADKPGNLVYFQHAKRLVRKGGVIIVDNVVRGGAVGRPDYSDENVEGVRRLLEHLKLDSEVEASTIATVGGKGYDGFMYILKL